MKNIASIIIIINLIVWIYFLHKVNIAVSYTHLDAENTSEQTFDENTDVSETPVISEQMLYELYTACLLYTSRCV